MASKPPAFMRAVLREIKLAQADFDDIVKTLPRKAKSKKQRELQAKHGSPRDYARAVIRAIGEISAPEAHEAIRNYCSEWEAAE